MFRRAQAPATFSPFCLSEQSTKAEGEICISSFLKFRRPLGIPRARGTTAPVICWEGNGEEKICNIRVQLLQFLDSNFITASLSKSTTFLSFWVYFLLF